MNKLKFLAGTSRIRLFAATLISILTLTVIVYIFCVEYPLKGDHETLSAAISDYASYKVAHSYGFIDAEVLGLNMRYQITEYSIAPIPYSASVIVDGMGRIKIGDENLLIGGYHCEGIHAYGIQFATGYYIEVAV